MRKEYDFSGARRAKGVPQLVKLQDKAATGKIRITTYLDSDIVGWFKAQGEQKHKAIKPS